ncbi:MULTISPECIES: N-acetyl-gamma-glutamyl-phosphate reductase [unclassified Exiguobacterium]|uniref:N-acetyl-gamma-glutamyl-phosphate reductase n=1 Tax=Exiguobacterium TaxID=33986 RepID=UPI00103D4C30|nr:MULTISPECIES: N-acetyl-gamma-glutamyl-phosphate reductase [unclassified Exiguobacterium]TCI70564.1 N-acetyl-gamma-glutamyl-phosphate reductase [Exiguobacterium sp. IPCI3]TCI79447.1 N-acetyl-gamma-glutamyl-phosphate reductase [Exiguobacterium sp. IPCH1]TCI82239.1 N-acetyl-gamma-glutamyl-phosphate reductase [Exiguobacterium sp. IPBC4]
MITCGIVGVTGYAGMELLKLIGKHPEFTLVRAMSDSSAGLTLEELYPWLETDKLTLEPFRMDVLDDIDVIFLATPSGVSAQYVKQLTEYEGVVIDLSGDLRLPASSYETWYDKPAVPTSLQAQAVYGLTEWNRDAVKTADRIANPGCYATAVALGLLPFVKGGWIDPNEIIVSACSGITGAGKGLSAKTHHARSNENVQLYKVHTHQHIPEIEQTLQTLSGIPATVSLSTHLLPINRGIMATMSVVPTIQQSEADWVHVLNEAYANEPFIRVQQGEPEIRTAVGSNYCDIWVYADTRTNRLTIVSVIDNMQKGAAGQAIQNANVRFGVNETAGLTEQPQYI